MLAEEYTKDLCKYNFGIYSMIVVFMRIHNLLLFDKSVSSSTIVISNLCLWYLEEIFIAYNNSWWA